MIFLFKLCPSPSSSNENCHKKISKLDRDHSSELIIDNMTENAAVIFRSSGTDNCAWIPKRILPLHSGFIGA